MIACQTGQEEPQRTTKNDGKRAIIDRGVKTLPLATELLNLQGSDEFEKAVRKAAEREIEDFIRGQGEEPRSAVIDPYNVLEHVGTRAKRSPFSYAILRMMALRAKPVAAIIQTRQNQMAKFMDRPAWQGAAGFRVKTKDPEQKMSAADKKRALQIEEFLLKTRMPGMPLGKLPNFRRRDDLDAFCRKIIRDRLTLDGAAVEFVPTLNGKGIAEFLAVDAATIEVANPDKYKPILYPEDEGRIAFVQKVSGRVEAEYTEEQLGYYIANPRTDLMYTDYGLSELEILIETVTAHLFAEQYNAKYFTQNTLPQGVLSVIGKYKQSQLTAFKRAWEAMISGVVNAWKVPIMAFEEGQGLNFVPFKQSNREMEFNLWLEYLTTVACAIYQIDPAEIGFKGFSSNGGNSKMDSDSTQTKIENSKDKGLEPLAKQFKKIMNELVERVDEEYCVEITGLNEEDETKRRAKQKDEIEMGVKLPIEVRNENDYGPLPTEDDQGNPIDNSWAYKPLNQVAANYITSAQQSQDQQAQTEGQQDHELASKEIEHQHHLEKQEQAHRHAKELAKHKGSIDKDKALSQAELQHQHTTEQAEDQRAHDKTMADHGHKLTKDQAEQGHQHRMTEAELGHQHATEQAEDADGRKVALAEQAHSHKMEQGEAGDRRKAAMQKEQAEQGHRHRLVEGEVTDQRGQEAEKRQAKRDDQTSKVEDSRADADHRRKMEEKTVDHRSKVEQIREKAKADVTSRLVEAEASRRNGGPVGSKKPPRGIKKSFDATLETERVIEVVIERL